MEKSVIAVMLVAGTLAFSLAQAQPSRHRLGIYARPGDLYFSYGQKTCRQKVGMKAAQRYVGWCLNWTMSRHPPCNVDNRCSMVLDPVVAECDRARQSNIDHPGKGDVEMAYCAEARRVYEPDQAEAERRQKAYNAVRDGKRLSDDEWQKVLKNLNAH
jgi:hypothetical protein